MAPQGSNIWEYFEKVPGDKKQDSVGKCNTCQKLIKAPGGTTSGLRKHLKTHPKLNKLLEDADKEKAKQKELEVRKRKQVEKDDLDVELECQPSQKKQTTLAGFIQTKTKYDIHSEEQKKFDDKIVEYIIKDLPSFSSINNEGFLELMNYAAPKFTVKDRKTYARKIEHKYENIMQQVNDIISKCKPEMESISCTTDMWTSRANDLYISLTLHYIDAKFKLHRWTPFVRNFHDCHTGVNINAELSDMIGTFEMPEEIPIYAVNDNAANVKLAISMSSMNEYLCCNHTLQLAIGDTFKNVPGMQSAVDICKKVASYVHKSTLANEILENKCVEMNITYKKLIQSVATRWNSELDCMKSVLHLKEVLNKLSVTCEQFEQFSLTPLQWETIEQACQMLKEFKVTTEIWSLEKEPSINTVVERLFLMSSNLKDFINNQSNSITGKKFAKELIKNLDIRFKDCGTNIDENSFANYLDPRLKGVHLKQFSKFEFYKNKLQNQIDEDNLIKENSTSSVASEGSLSPTSKLKKQFKTKTNTKTKIETEFDCYETCKDATKNESVLIWWRKNQYTFPILSKFARKYLSIPASSTKSERVFSTSGNVVTAKRCNLDPDLVEQLVVCHENIFLLKEF